MRRVREAFSTTFSISAKRNALPLLTAPRNWRSNFRNRFQVVLEEGWKPDKVLIFHAALRWLERAAANKLGAGSTYSSARSFCIAPEIFVANTGQVG